MDIKKDFQNVLFSFGAVFLSMSISASVYHMRDAESLSARVVPEREEVITDNATQYSLHEDTVSEVEDIESVAEVVVPSTSPVVEDTSAKSKALLEAERLAIEKAKADALIQQIAETQAMIDALAKEKAIADVVVTEVKKSRKSRAS